MKSKPGFLRLALIFSLVLAAGCATTGGGGGGGKVSVQGAVLALTAKEDEKLPVPDAKVTASMVDDANKTVASTTTDRRGKFSLNVRQGSYTIWVAKEGFFENHVNASFMNEVNRVDVILDQHNRLFGAVTEPDGSPANPAVIEARNEKLNKVFSGATAQDGKYEVSNLPTGRYIVVARTPDGRLMRRGESQVAGGSVELNIQLEVNMEETSPAMSDLPMKAIGEGGGEVAIK